MAVIPMMTFDGPVGGASTVAPLTVAARDGPAEEPPAPAADVVVSGEPASTDVFC